MFQSIFAIGNNVDIFKVGNEVLVQPKRRSPELFPLLLVIGILNLSFKIQEAFRLVVGKLPF